MMQLTHYRRNLIGDGCMETANGGLSDFGRAVVKEMNRTGIMIDLSHAGWQTAIDAAKCSSRPVIISHAAVWNLCRHVRCKPDEVIRAVVDSGGTIGITNAPALLGGSGDISAFLDHIDYVADRFGVDAVTIGTSSGFSYPDNETPSIFQNVSQHVNWENQWQPEQKARFSERGTAQQIQSMAWTNWPLFTVGLVQRGYSDVDIEKIIGGIFCGSLIRLGISHGDTLIHNRFIM